MGWPSRYRRDLAAGRAQRAFVRLSRQVDQGTCLFVKWLEVAGSSGRRRGRGGDDRAGAARLPLRPSRSGPSGSNRLLAVRIQRRATALAIMQVLMKAYAEAAASGRPVEPMTPDT